MPDAEQVLAWLPELGESCGAGKIQVTLDGGRSHLVQVFEHDDGIELSGMAATSNTLAELGLTAEEIWRRNHSRRLTGLVVDHDGLWVTCRLPYAGLTLDELLLVGNAVAREADRLELHYNGFIDEL